MRREVFYEKLVVMVELTTTRLGVLLVALVLGIGWKEAWCHQNQSIRLRSSSSGGGNSRLRLKIGVVYSGAEDVFARDKEKLAVEYAVERVNREEFFVRNELFFQPKIVKLPVGDSFRALKYVCNGLLREGVLALIDMDERRTPTSVQIEGLLAGAQVPFLNALWPPTGRGTSEPSRYGVNVRPDWRELSAALVALVRHLEWTGFVFIYEHFADAKRLMPLIEHFGNKQSLVMHELPASRSLWKSALKTLIPAEHGTRPPSAFLVDVGTDSLEFFLESAMQVGILTRGSEFVFANMDLDTVNMERYVWLDARLTGFQIVDRNGTMLRRMVKDWMLNEFKGARSPLENERTFRTSSALVYDMVRLLAAGVRRLKRANQPLNVGLIKCNQPRSVSAVGERLLRALRPASMNGSTGRLAIDALGRRVDFKLDLVELRRDGAGGMEKIGEWDPVRGLVLAEPAATGEETTTPAPKPAPTVKNRTLTLTTILEKPYVHLKRDWEHVEEENERYEGFCIDLLVALSQLCNFTYRIVPVPDNKYGAPNEKGEWNGLVRELMEGRADLALAPLTINLARSKVIDLSKPFLTLGISILFKRPEPKAPSLFSFLAPLSAEVWISMLIAYFITGFMMFVISRFSPFEWKKREYCNARTNLVYNQFTMNNAFWFVFTSFIHLGIDINPHAPSTRALNCAWSLFTLIVMASYTANLAAFLTVKRMEVPIENADDLAEQSKIKYGALAGGSTETFFRESKLPTYEKMWSFMKLNPAFMANTTAEGIKRVKQGNYAFLLESTSNEYARQRDCDLMQVGDLLDHKNYGFGLPKGSKWSETISNGILMLQEKGVIQQIYDKWWKQIGAQNCDGKGAGGGGDQQGDAMTISSVGGIFVVLAIGIVISCFVSVAEITWKTRKTVDSQGLKVEYQRSLVRFKDDYKCIGKFQRRRHRNKGDNSLFSKRKKKRVRFLLKTVTETTTRD